MNDDYDCPECGGGDPHCTVCRGGPTEGQPVKATPYTFSEPKPARPDPNQLKLWEQPA